MGVRIPPHGDTHRSSSAEDVGWMTNILQVCPRLRLQEPGQTSDRPRLGAAKNARENAPSYEGGHIKECRAFGFKLMHIDTTSVSKIFQAGMDQTSAASAEVTRQKRLSTDAHDQFVPASWRYRDAHR